MPIYRPRFVTAFPLLLLLAGCVGEKIMTPDPRAGDVAVRSLEAAPSDSYAAAEKGVTYRGPDAFEENATPVYPESLLALRLPPVDVKARVIVDGGGSVTEVSPLDPGAVDPAFFASVAATVRGWQYSPLIRGEPGPGHTTVETPLPFHMDYEFTFTQRDGKGSVSAAQRE